MLWVLNKLDYLSGMHNECDMAVPSGGEGAECCDDGVLPVVPVSVPLLAQPQHELHVVHHHVGDIVHVARVFYCLGISRRVLGTLLIRSYSVGSKIGLLSKGSRI